MVRSRGLALVVDADRALAALWRNHRAHPDATPPLPLFERYTGFAHRLAAGEARRLAGLGLEPAEFRQLAGEAMLQALDRFDPLLAVPFEAFVRPRIRGHIRNAIDQASEAGAQHSHRRRVERDRVRSLTRGARDETVAAVDVLADMAAKLAIGLILETAAIPEPDMLPADEPSAYDTLAWRQLCGELDRRLALLPDKEAFVLDRHYRHGEQFQQIAMLLGLSKGRVSQLHAQGLDRLRKHMARHR